jgi:hypothetical protein
MYIHPAESSSACYQIPCSITPHDHGSEKERCCVYARMVEREGRLKCEGGRKEIGCEVG